MLGETVREAARRFGDNVAYVTPAGWGISYRDIDQISDHVAAALSERGLRAGDVLAIISPPGPEYLLAYCAAAKAGLVTAGVNDRLGEEERRAVLETAGPSLVICRAGYEISGFEHAAVAPATSPEDILDGVRTPGSAPPVLEADPDRPAAIIFTSGTTGLPKGALYCERQLRFITDTDVGDAWGSGGRSYTGTSFAHLGFMTKLPGNLRRGGTSFILERWRADACLDLVSRERLSSIGGVPTQLALMLRHPRFDDYDLSSVQALVAGGGPVTPGLAEEARRRFRARLATRYSCTEAGIGLGTGFDDPDEDAVVSVGRPLPGVELQVLDDHDGVVPAGEVGQVCLRSPAVMTGYWRDPEATAAAFTRDGFVRTGDLGWVDERGRLRLVGRTKEMYVRGGYNVYPVEVEGVLSEHPAVAGVAVIPRVDPVMGEIGVAVVVARDGSDAPTLETLRDFASSRLAHHKLPEDLRVVSELPLTIGEKIDRGALAAEVAGRGADDSGSGGNAPSVA